MSRRSVLVLNAGSSSLKWVVLDAQTEAVQDQGDATWEGSDVGRHDAELKAALERVPEVDAVGHRVVHGGSPFREAAVADAGVRDQIPPLPHLAPLHNPPPVTATVPPSPP